MYKFIYNEGSTSMSTRRPKLMIVENSRHLTGAFTAATAIIDTLKDTYDIEFVLPSTSALRPMIEEKGVRCHQLPMIEIGRSLPRITKYIPQLILNSIRLRRLLNKQRTDILLINDYYNLLGATVKATGWNGRLITMVRLLPWKQQKILNRMWVKIAMQFSDTIGAVSIAVQHQLPSSNKVRLIYNPTWISERHSDSDVVATGKVNCLYLANYIRGKGQDYAIEAFAKAHRKNPELHLHFFGSDMGLKKNLDWKNSLRDRVEILNITNAVSFHGFSDDVEKEIKQADIVLNFSDSESFSQTCFEASAFGKPVIATRCGGPEEIIDDGISGILVQLRDTEQMANAITRLATDKNLRLAMGDAGKIIVRARFSETVFREAFEKA